MRSEKYIEHLACMRAGIGAVRCKWGSVQEATALFEFMHAMPAGALEEVGLCRVQPDALLESFGFSAGQLPPWALTGRPAAAAPPLACLCGTIPLLLKKLHTIAVIQCVPL